MKKPKIYTIKNFKGGVGKTTLTVNLAAAFANKQNPLTKKPYNVLVIDCDSHAGASIYMLGIHYWNKVNANSDGKKRLLNLEDLLTNKKQLSDEYLYPKFNSSEETPIFNPLITEDNIKFERRYENGSKQFWKNLFLLPASSKLTHLNEGKEVISETLFQNLLSPYLNKFDFVFLDTGAYFDNISKNAISISDSILIPFFVEQISINGICNLITELTDFISKHDLGGKVKIEEIIPMNYTEKTKIAKEILTSYKKTIENYVNNRPEQKALVKGALLTRNGCSDRIEYKNAMNENRPVIDSNSVAKNEIEFIRDYLLKRIK